MNQLGFRAARVLQAIAIVLTVLFWFSPASVRQAEAAVMPGGNGGWLVVASRPTAPDAINVARSYSNRFPQTTVFQSNNGWFAITLGWMTQPAGNRYKSSLLASGLIPGDSYFHNGQRFQFAVWSATGITGGASQALFASTRLNAGSGGGTVSPPTSQQGYVTGLDPRGDNFLSLRTGPSTRYREIARMGMNTPLTILGRSGSWLNVAMADGRSGWAYGKYVASTPGFAPQPTPPTVAPSPVTPPTVAKRSITPPRRGIVGDLARTGDDFLSLRAGAGASHSEIARMLEGTEVTMLAQQGAWFEVELSNGMRGWAYGRYLDAAPPKQAETPSVPTIGPEPEQQAGLPNQNGVTEPNSNLPDLGTLPEGKRVALIIGNSAYEHAPFLPNPKNDATDLMESLKRLGFTVILGLDQSKVAMEGTVRTYVRTIQDADVALFFYAGHAMQLGGRNYLIPIDAKLEDQTAVDFETIELGTLLDYMNAPGRLSIALLDACRDNPLSRRFSRSLGVSRSSQVERGLAAPQAGGGNILIGFATAPGEVALDGDEDNSPFTTALLSHIETPGLEIEIMMKRVKADVYAATRGTQSPWHNSALRKEFYFKN
ncbi:caspase family protein [Roseibium sp. MMSF_3544]|uniref:caspase family protein n=1 Tax=unclassified Roseibium TaxID=2629323 RepID=UPI00273E85DC|nr:caspase family protein [Roseibium sp. MMSF_3544]